MFLLRPVFMLCCAIAQLFSQHTSCKPAHFCQEENHAHNCHSTLCLKPCQLCTAVQVDTHINNQYNTCYWALRQQVGKTPSEAQAVLKGTLADFKNEMLFTQFGINYNSLPARFRKGSVIIRCMQLVSGSEGAAAKHRSIPTVLHVDIIKDEFWQQHPEILK